MTQSTDKKIKLSLIIAAWNGISHLTRCLSSLEDQLKNSAAEVIVISNYDTGILEEKSNLKIAMYINLPDKTTVPQLLACGIQQAQGAVIALTEDFCIFDSNWYKETEKIHNYSYAAVGGTIENTTDQNALDWAVFFYDYGKYMSPNIAGITDTVSGMNVLYKRDVIEKIQTSIEDGFFETFINAELKHKGYEIYMEPSIIIYHNKKYNLKKTINQFYHQARYFAARRGGSSTLSKRLFFVPASLILPVLLPFRIVVRTIKKGSHLEKLLLALPYLTILMSVWSFGEFIGYLTGEGGSGDHWR